MARAGFGPKLDARELQHALLSAIADRRGCCSWKARWQAANPAQIVVDNCHENCVDTVNGCVNTVPRRSARPSRETGLEHWSVHAPPAATFAPP
jgi:hypothetical protein